MSARKSVPAEKSIPPADKSPGVVILRVTQPDGSVQVQITEINGLDPLAVPTLLRVAADVKEKGFTQ